MSPGRTPPKPTAAQVKTTTAVVRWYLERHFQRGEEPGLAAMFCDPKKVGAFALTLDELARGEGGALFRLLVATTLFQRLQDVLVLKILREMAPEAALELTSKERLLSLAEALPCPCIKSTAALHESCDLGKDSQTGAGCCAKNPALPCQPSTLPKRTCDCVSTRQVSCLTG